MKIITSFSTLMRYAYELGQAELSKDEKRIKRAKEEHDAYRDLCLASDEMTLNVTKGAVS